jgi:GNAT superfamily N-acetyltransferase
VVAEQDGRVVGVAMAHVRDDLWGLALLVVAPEAQGTGLGRRLLDASLVSADGCSRGVISSSRSPAAIRRTCPPAFSSDLPSHLRRAPGGAGFHLVASTS